MRKLSPSFKKIAILFLMIAIVIVFSYYPLKPVHATGITAISDTQSRMQKSPTTSSHTMKFTTTNAIQTTGDTITFTFPADYNFTTKSIATVTFTHGATTGLENTETLAASADGTNWGAAFSGTQNRVFTLTAPTDGIGAAAVAASDKLIITYSAANSVNPTTAGTYLTTIAVAGSTTESGSFAVAILDNDQFQVTATVDPTITFSIDQTTTDFGVVTSTGVKTASPNVVLQTSTNAGSGYVITVHDAGNTTNPGLYNSVATYLLGSANATYDNTADLNSVAGYGVQASSATATIAADYNQSGTTVGGYKLTAKQIASYGGPASAQQVTLVHKAKVLGSAPAGSYSDTITVIATANF